MIKFGPSGNSAAFYDAGYKSTFQAMQWIAQQGLTAYEYPFGRGVRISEAAAEKIRREAEQYNITLSVHAPYFINLASDDAEKLQKNIGYFADASRAAEWLGARRVVFHPGSCAKLDRDWAFARTRENFCCILAEMDALGHRDLTYCPETMGKVNQIGTLEEIIALCNVDERVLPTIDFGHLHTRDAGCINSAEDFERILCALIDGIGRERTRRMHVHFSKIAFTKMGEKAHMTFADAGYGPDFAQLAPLLKKYDLEPTIICESAGTMAQDACAMKKLYEEAML